MRATQTLTADESSRLRKRLLQSVTQTPNPARTLAQVVGCSLSTAKRILGNRHTGCLKRAYAVKAASYLGMSVSKLCGPPAATNPTGDKKTNTLELWNTATTREEALQRLETVTRTILNYAYLRYGMLATYAASVNVSGRPETLTLMLKHPACNSKQCLFAFEPHASITDQIGMRVNIGDAVVYDGSPDWSVIKICLAKLTKTKHATR